MRAGRRLSSTSVYSVVLYHSASSIMRRTCVSVIVVFLPTMNTLLSYFAMRLINTRVTEEAKRNSIVKIW